MFFDVGPYLVLLSSTINGYEGTGRSLSLKLIHDIKMNAASATPTAGMKFLHRTLREISLEEPIRYGPGDAVETWLHRLLCLDATVPAPLAAHVSPLKSSIAALAVFVFSCRALWRLPPSVACI